MAFSGSQYTQSYFGPWHLYGSFAGKTEADPVTPASGGGSGTGLGGVSVGLAIQGTWTGIGAGGVSGPGVGKWIGDLKIDGIQ